MTRPTVRTERLVTRLDRLGFGVEESETTTVLQDLDRPLDLETAAAGLDLEEIVYDPDRFPGLLYRPDDAAAMAVLFDDGTLFIESADGFGELIGEITDGLEEVGMGGDIDPIGSDFVVSPHEVPVPAEFSPELGTETSVYPDEGSEADEPPSGSGSDTKIYSSGGTDAPADGAQNETTDAPETDDEQFDPDTGGSESSQGSSVHVATISEKRDAMVVIDAIHDGDLVIADIARHSMTDSTMDDVVDSLRQVTEDVGGDIVQKGEDELILAPAGMEVARKKLT
ncbi:cell division protein SepF [Halobellus ordinarius]|uniref:cell division protein SepF n=1 Tax=Halobellus ordinarius TaxID=3075120 RepID=UPI0028803A79|nr:cell division protein SepF [Halobellus sp. ZY16]